MTDSGGQQSYKFLRNGVEKLVEYDRQCCLFLERMRHASSYDIVQKFKSFINEFMGKQYNTDKECSTVIHTFIEDIFVSISEHALWKEESHTAWDWATEAAERYLLTKLFKVTFVLPCTQDIEDDERFYHRVRTLQFLKTSHFDIPDRPLNQVAIEMAAHELNKADNENMKSPKEKLSCMLNSIIILSNLLKYYNDEKGTGADDILPYVIFTILLLSPRHMHSNIRFISRFRRESKMKSEAAYYFTQMESAVLFIMDTDHRNLSISEQDFKLGVERCEEIIASGLDINQFKATTSDSNSVFADRRPDLTSESNDVKPSPILARKASVIKEWSNLQRTRALSQSEDDKPSELKVNTEPLSHAPVPLSPSPAMPIKPSPLAVQSLQDGNGNRNVTDTGLGMELNQKFLSAKFEDLTVNDLKLLLDSYKTLATPQQPPQQH